jgi:hypothetical protein
MSEEGLTDFEKLDNELKKLDNLGEFFEDLVNKLPCEIKKPNGSKLVNTPLQNKMVGGDDFDCGDIDCDIDCGEVECNFGIANMFSQLYHTLFTPSLGTNTTASRNGSTINTSTNTNTNNTTRIELYMNKLKNQYNKTQNTYNIIYNDIVNANKTSSPLVIFDIDITKNADIISEFITQVDNEINKYYSVMDNLTKKKNYCNQLPSSTNKSFIINTKYGKIPFNSKYIKECLYKQYITKSLLYLFFVFDLLKDEKNNSNLKGFKRNILDSLNKIEEIHKKLKLIIFGNIVNIVIFTSSIFLNRPIQVGSFKYNSNTLRTVFYELFNFKVDFETVESTTTLDNPVLKINIKNSDTTTVLIKGNNIVIDYDKKKELIHLIDLIQHTSYKSDYDENAVNLNSDNVKNYIIEIDTIKQQVLGGQSNLDYNLGVNDNNFILSLLFIIFKKNTIFKFVIDENPSDDSSSISSSQLSSTPDAKHDPIPSTNAINSDVKSINSSAPNKGMLGIFIWKSIPNSIMGNAVPISAGGSKRQLRKSTKRKHTKHNYNKKKRNYTKHKRIY